jgi:hypothetical protein
MLIKLLIIFFIFLIGYQLFLFIFKKNNLVEGLENEETPGEYKPYNKDDPNNTLILAQQNAGNIEVLKGRVDKLDGIKERVDSLQQIADGMQTQIDGLVQQQADYANDLMGDKPPPLEGTEGYDADTAVDDMEEEDPESEPVNL